MIRCAIDDLDAEVPDASLEQLVELLKRSELARSELTDAYSVLAGAGLHPATQLKLGAAVAEAGEMVALAGKNLTLIAQVVALIDQAVQELRACDVRRGFVNTLHAMGVLVPMRTSHQPKCVDSRWSSSVVSDVESACWGSGRQ